MLQETLWALSIMYAGTEKLRNLTFQEIKDDVALDKSRKENFNIQINLL